MQHTAAKDIKELKDMQHTAAKDIKELKGMQHTAHHTFLFILVEPITAGAHWPMHHRSNTRASVHISNTVKPHVAIRGSK